MLDATKIVPEELVPVMPVGKLVLNRNPDNFFAETEQVAFCTAHVVPGIDFTNDPLLAGRIHSYVDTQISRLGRAELPRDSDQRAGRAGAQQPARRHASPGDQPRPRRLRAELARRRLPVPGRARRASCRSRSRWTPDAHKVRGKAERFADHYTQATLFWNSQTPVEQTHIINAFRFELSRVQTPAIRERMVSGLMNVAPELAEAVADGLGMPAAAGADAEGRCTTGGHARGDAVAGAVAVRAAGRRQHPHAPRRDPRRRRRRRRRAAGARRRAGGRGAVPRFVGPTLGAVTAADGDAHRGRRADRARRRCCSTRVVLPDGADAVERLAADGRMLEFVKDQYRHCKPILVLGAASALLDKAGIPPTLPTGEADPGLIVAKSR